MKPISINEIQNLKHAVQYFQDCYLVSSIGALAKSENGRKILAQNIAHTKDGYCVKFRNIDGKSKDFFVSQKETEDLIYMDKYLNPMQIPADKPHNPIIKAIEVAMSKLLTETPSKKPWICRFPKCNENFEFNKPSNFLEMFTGKKPISINENNLRLSLKGKKEESMDIFNKLKDTPDNSFVMGSSFGFDAGISNTHCYRVENVNPQYNTIDLFDHRLLRTITLTFDEAIKKMKFIVGYFDKDLK